MLGGARQLCGWQAGRSGGWLNTRRVGGGGSQGGRPCSRPPPTDSTTHPPPISPMHLCPASPPTPHAHPPTPPARRAPPGGRWAAAAPTPPPPRLQGWGWKEEGQQPATQFRRGTENERLPGRSRTHRRGQHTRPGGRAQLRRQECSQARTPTHVEPTVHKRVRKPRAAAPHPTPPCPAPRVQGNPKP